jgi:sarcosine oxidase subunit alpha
MIHVDRDSTAPKRVGDDSGRIDPRFPDHRSIKGRGRVVPMTQPFRLETGGRVARGHKIGFRFDGRDYAGLQGDTLASALLANGVHLVGRSFKYHRPRGILSAGSEEPNALVTVDRGGGRITPNVRATQIELYEGLTATSQNRWPSLEFDAGAAAGWASPLLSAGFYYKTFLWPPAFWAMLYEPAIRAAAGLGKAPTGPDPDRYVHQYTHCEILVIGAGPAGIAAALAAASTGVRVMLCDEQAELGGSLLTETCAVIDGKPASDWLSEALASLEGRVTLLPRTTAFGWYPDNMIGLHERLADHLENPDPNLPRERLWQVRAREVILATGAIERPLVFPHNDRPGIMLAGAARSYANRWAVAPGRAVAVAAADDSAYTAALDLQRAGVIVAAILDQRRKPRPIAEEARAAGLIVRNGTRVEATSGRKHITALSLGNRQGTIECDALLMSGGWTPSVHLFSQSRGKLRFDETIGAFLPGEAAARVRCAGACTGVFGLAACLDSGYAAGNTSVQRTFSVAGVRDTAPSRPHAPAAPHPSAFVDFQNDVTTKDLSVATQEGFRSIEHVKRYTTSGMATDQGKTSNINTLATVAGLTGRTMTDVGLTSFRPPFTPVTFGAFAGTARGALFDPVRHAPLHDWAAAQGAVFEDVGTWKRARYFPRSGETMHDAVSRECLAVRNACGILDASTLGKIEVAGPDAAAFLDRIYVNDVASLPIGRCRYALLLGEDGFIRDDGVIARLADDRFHVTTTTGGAASVLHMMEDYLQTEFPALRAWLTSTTEHWATIALQGPLSRSILAALVEGIDITAMPHMGVRECNVAGVRARLFRVSFTGEAGFEIAIPASQAGAVWDALMGVGKPTPYGTEAMHVLRAEKGFVIVGQETDGTVIPADLGFGGIGRNKHDFVGKRSLSRPDMLRKDRRQLVGLLTDDPAAVLEEGAQILAKTLPLPLREAAGGRGNSGTVRGDFTRPRNPLSAPSTSLGHVTSAYWSATLGRSIALALVFNGQARIGDKLIIPMPNGPIPVSVVAPVFFDPEGQRLNTHVPIQAGCVAAARANPTQATTRLIVRAPASAMTAIGLALGVLLGSVPNRAVRGRDRAALWLGPDEWLAIAPSSDNGLADRVIAATQHASVVDVSDRFETIALNSPHAAWLLNGFCALDLAPHIFPVGMCTRTLFGKAEIVLWRTASDGFHIEVARSLARYVRQCLDEAQRGFLAAPDVC